MSSEKLANNSLSLAIEGYGARASFVAVISGVLIAVLILFAIGAHPLLFEFHKEGWWWLIPLMAIVLFSWSWYLGKLFGRKVAVGRNPYVWGILLAFLVIALSVLTITVPWALIEALNDVSTYGVAHSLSSFVIAPLFWIFLFGTLPAFLLGLFWGYALWRQKNRLLSQGQH